MNMGARYTEFTYALAVGGRVQITVTADFIACLAASGDFDIAFGGAPASPFRAGLQYRAPEAVQAIEIINRSAAANTITLATGLGGFQDSRLSLTGTIANRPEVPDQFNDLGVKTCLNAAVTALAAAGPLRRQLIATNTGTGTVYVTGNGGGVAGSGVPLTAGATVVLDTNDAVFCRNDTGATVTVNVSEIGWTS